VIARPEEIAGHTIIEAVGLQFQLSLRLNTIIISKVSTIYPFAINRAIGKTPDWRVPNQGKAVDMHVNMDIGGGFQAYRSKQKPKTLTYGHVNDNVHPRFRGLSIMPTWIPLFVAGFNP
jgi:hypothetical protein